MQLISNYAKKRFVIYQWAAQISNSAFYHIFRWAVLQMLQKTG